MPRNFDPWVEALPHGDQKIYVLRSAELDNCSSAIEVHMKTQDLGYRFKGALAALYGIGPINTREVLQLFSGGIALNYRHTILIGNSAVISVSGHWKD